MTNAKQVWEYYIKGIPARIDVNHGIMLQYTVEKDID